MPENWAEEVQKEANQKAPFSYDVVYEEDRKKVGYHLYNRLRASYNQKNAKGDTPSPFNTLVVYTMDGVMNAEQAGRCIVNYYRNMTARIQEEFCFCGDRVGILGQSNKILDDPKDTKTDQKLMYKVSDIIRIGMNEATHMAMQKKIKTGDFLNPTAGTQEPEKEDGEALRFVKEHIRNRCIPAYPDEPIYVKQLLKGVQQNILRLEQPEPGESREQKTERMARRNFFNLFHVMLHTLRYTNEIVVDLSRNSLQALFWLGVAHGSNVHAITVRHAPTEQELQQSGDQEKPSERHIFDVAGLWTAILRSNDTDGFYQQLAMAQMGIEQSNKLILPDSEKYREDILEQYHAPSPYGQGGYGRFLRRLEDIENQSAENPGEMLLLLQEIRDNERLCAIWDTLTRQNQAQSKQLESYYRTCFWQRLLRQNALHLYIPEKNGKLDDEKKPSQPPQPCRVNISWDVNATAELSHYLSKRLMIGSYRQTMLRKKDPLPEVHKQNFITIGNDTTLFSPGKTGKQRTLVEYARDSLEPGALRKMMEYEIPCPHGGGGNMIVRGFFEQEDRSGARDAFAWFPMASCVGSMINLAKPEVPTPGKAHKIQFGSAGPGQIESCGCDGVAPASGCYKQLAQMVLWREAADESRREMRFWVSLVGVSGPATLALTTLLVHPDQQEELFHRNGPSRMEPDPQTRNPLNRLQTEIRKAFLKKYNELLAAKIQGDSLQKVRYATNLYLSTVLYQYFFPFLTRADEMRIKNGMQAFLSADDRRICDCGSAKEVIRALEEAMETLQGVEALYTVEVEYNDADTDSRWPKEIRPLQRNDAEEVRCLFKQ